MKKIIIIISVLVVISCNSNNGLNMVVENQTESQLSNIIITTDDSIAELKIENIEIDHTEKGFLNMNDVTIRDGSYRIEYNIEGENRIKEFGYYTNGYPLESKIVIKIYPDSVIIDGKLGYF